MPARGFYRVNGKKIARRRPDGTIRDQIFADVEKLFRRQRERIKFRLGLLHRDRNFADEYQRRKQKGTDANE